MSAAQLRLVRLHVKLATENAEASKAKFTSVMFWKGIVMIFRGVTL